MYRRNNLAYRIVDSFFRHKWIFLLSTLATTLVVLGALLSRAQGYTATAMMAVDQDKDLVGMTTNVVSRNPALDHANRFDILMRDDSTNGFLERALEKAGMARPIRVNPPGDPRLTELRRNLKPGTANREVMTMKLDWPNKNECENILGAFQDTYKDWVGETKQAASIAQANFLDAQIKAYQARLDEASQALQEYRSKNFGKLPAAQQGTIDRLSALKGEMDFMKVTDQDYAQRIKYLEERKALMSQRDGGSVVSDVKVSRSPNYDNLLRLRQQREMLILSDYLPGSETVRTLDEQIAAYTKILEREAAQNPPGAKIGERVESKTLAPNLQLLDVDQQIADAKLAAGVQTDRKKALAAQIAQYEKTVKELPEAERKLAEKTSDEAIIRSQMNLMLAQREKVRLKASIDKLTEEAAMQPLGRITASSTSSMSKTLQMVVGSILIGLIAGVIVVAAREWLDPAIRYEPDVQRALGVPVLAGLLDSREVLALPEGEGRRASRPVLPSPPTENPA